MKGIDKLLEKLNEETTGRIREIVKQCDIQCSSIMEEARATAASEAKLIEQNFRNKTASEIARENALFDLNERIERSGAMRRVLDEIYDKAAKKIDALTDTELLSAAVAAAKKVLKPGDKAIVILSNAENAKKAAEELEKLIPDCEFSGEGDGGISGGFILRCVGCEYNFTTVALIARAREEWEGEIVELVFGA